MKADAGSESLSESLCELLSETLFQSLSGGRCLEAIQGSSSLRRSVAGRRLLVSQAAQRAGNLQASKSWRAMQVGWLSCGTHDWLCVRVVRVSWRIMRVVRGGDWQGICCMSCAYTRSDKFFIRKS